MPRSREVDPVTRAFFDAWIDDDVMPDEIRDERIETFRTRWGTLEANAFERALQEGDEADRLWALFALGYLAPSYVGDLLVPFLHSPIRKERWASAIALGENKIERAFPFLQALLLERMEYIPSPVEKDLKLLEADARQRRPHTNSVTLILDLLHDPTYASLFKQQGRLPARWSELWHRLEDHLAYALGQLDASKPFDELALPPVGLRLAQMYFVFGVLKIHNHYLYDGDILKLIYRDGLDPDALIHALQHHFGLTEPMSRDAILDFEQGIRSVKRDKGKTDFLC